ncbi:MAG: ATP-binding protein [Clostridia bacterium]|nr:ATP-binding protein [Clostridia bacterium]
MNHDNFVCAILSQIDIHGRIKCRERNDLEYKETFNICNFSKYAKTMAAFANNQGGYIVFGVKDNPRELKGVNQAFFDFEQEKFTNALNNLFSPELIWTSNIVESNGKNIGYIYTAKSLDKPVVALKVDNGEKINSGDVYYRYRARSEKIKYPEMRKIVEDRAKEEQERIFKLIETIKNSETTNLGIIDYMNGHITTPYGVDVAIDKQLVVKILKKAKYIKSGSFNETEGIPVIKVSGNIDLAEEIPVPNIIPDVQYPYIQKNLKEQLKVNNAQIAALIWYYKIREHKKFHIEISTSATSLIKIHKYSDIALQYLADKINENNEKPDWLLCIENEYKDCKRLRRTTNGQA